MELRWARLCMELDCNTVFDGIRHESCPACGSAEVYPLEAWLNRDRDQWPRAVSRVRDRRVTLQRAG